MDGLPRLSVQYASSKDTLGTWLEILPCGILHYGLGRNDIFTSAAQPTAPVLYAYQPWINYLAVHLLLTAAFSAAPSLPTNAELLSSLDLVLFPLDAILRTNAITSTLAHLSPGSQLISPILSHSPLFHFVLGCTASSGGGISAATLGVWNPNWGSGGFTPAFLRKGPRSPFNSILNTLDVWGGGVVAVIYGISTSHIAFHPLVVYLSPYIRVFSLIDTKEIKPLSPLGGKSLAAAALMVLFGVRALSARLQTLPLPPGTAQGKGKI
ncbi:hypothetical protein D9757_002912 [Collybiopsis confluens]|uniref:Uncharacterized protein n=1 Tax=Collybiopsis confluens TaxID=2823264 RepID=A0A8H5HVB7_9AGAR|nr:hypothetical protein D9757_002912 [Collybiopsis confluens]